MQTLLNDARHEAKHGRTCEDTITMDKILNSIIQKPFTQTRRCVLRLTEIAFRVARGEIGRGIDSQTGNVTMFERIQANKHLMSARSWTLKVKKCVEFFRLPPSIFCWSRGSGRKRSATSKSVLSSSSTIHLPFKSRSCFSTVAVRGCAWPPVGRSWVFIMSSKQCLTFTLLCVIGQLVSTIVTYKMI